MTSKHRRQIRSRWGMMVLIGGVAIGLPHAGAAGAHPDVAGLVVPAIGDFPISQVGEKDLLSDQIFMKPMWGMAVEEVRQAGDGIVVTTTGAVFQLNPAESRIRCAQRLGKARPTVSLQMGKGALAGLRVVAKGGGGVVLASDAGVRVKINCDSLLMLRVADATTLNCKIPWNPDVIYPARSSRLVMDPFGAVALLPISGKIGLEKGASKQACAYQLGAKAEFWVSVGPPRPYRWKDSLNDRLIWQGSWLKPELAVPADEKIKKWSAYGNILWLQSENQLWKSWHEAFEPRLPKEFARVIRTAHGLGLRVMAYASPFYFTKGVGGNHTAHGKNVGQYLEALADLYRRFGDLNDTYFDGVYGQSVANTYRLCRATRAFLGDERRLMIHCTTSPPAGGLAYNPAADTYANMILRGEGQGFRGATWLRYYISGYNVSNAVGVVCNNAGYWVPTREQVEMTLRTNCRLTYMPFDAEEWPNGKTVRIVHLRPEVVEKNIVEALSSWYWPRLERDYQSWFEAINASADFTSPPPPPAAPPHPVAGLTLSAVRSAAGARIVYESFGADAPEYRSTVSLNGVALGNLPGGDGDKWAAGPPIPISKEALRSIKPVNRLTIKNLNRDAFKLRKLYLEFTLADGRVASSNLIQSAYCSADTWAHAEGVSVPLGAPIEIDVPIPVTGG